MHAVSASLLIASRSVVSEVQRLLSRVQRPIVVAVDGGSGAGKSTLASLIESDLDAALTPLDDFFAAAISDPQWDEFSVAEKLQRAFDWDRLRDHAIQPLLEGKPARWQAFDFESGFGLDGTSQTGRASQESA